MEGDGMKDFDLGFGRPMPLLKLNISNPVLKKVAGTYTQLQHSELLFVKRFMSIPPVFISKVRQQPYLDLVLMGSETRLSGT